MYDLFSLLAIFALVWFIATPVLLVLHIRLRRRVAKIQEQLETIQSGIKPTAPVAKVQKPQQTSWLPPESAPQERANQNHKPQAQKPPPSIAQNLPEATEPRFYVFKEEALDALICWFKINWVLAAGAASLALAGIFMVQYGIEQGLLGPSARIVLALVFGSGLIAGGEFLRRRTGDDQDNPSQHLPSSLSGAGLVVLFGAILAARLIYDLIQPEAAFFGLGVVSVLTIVLGWLYGPVLTAIGLLGATVAPFLIGGKSDDPWILNYYFLMIALVGLSIDSVKRWAWVSVLALVATLGAIWLLYLATSSGLHLMTTSVLIAIAALVIPERQLIPRYEGPGLLDLLDANQQLPSFPVRLSIFSFLNATLATTAVVSFGEFNESLLGLMTLALLAVLGLIWLSRAPALWDHAIFALMGFVTAIGIQSFFGGSLLFTFMASTPTLETKAPSYLGWLFVTIALCLVWIIFARLSNHRLNQSVSWVQTLILCIVGAVLVPSIVFLLEVFWAPSAVYGTNIWSLILFATALVLAIVAWLSARTIDLGYPKLAPSLFSLAALSLSSLALFLLLSETALTLALSVTILFVALIDRRFNMPLFSSAAVVGTSIVTARILTGSGLSDFSRFLFGSSSGPYWDTALVHLGTLALLIATYFVYQALRPRIASVVEGASWLVLAVFVLVSFERFLPGAITETHWGNGLIAFLIATMALAQAHRLKDAKHIELIQRLGLLAVFLAYLAYNFILLFGIENNPLLDQSESILGSAFISSLFTAYVPLALVFIFAHARLQHAPKEVSFAMLAIGASLIAWYTGLSIRHFWHGPQLSNPGVLDPELYSYTLAMLAVSIAALVFAFLRRIAWLHTAAMIGIGLTIAKVFFIDASGLSGLMRVLSFLGLGFCLVALTWLNRRMAQAWRRDEEPNPV